MGIDSSGDIQNNTRSSLTFINESIANDILATHFTSVNLHRTSGDVYEGLEIIYRVIKGNDIKCKFFALVEGKMIIAKTKDLLELVEVSELEMFSCLYLWEGVQ